MKIGVYYKKIVVSGKVTEVFEYEKGVFTDYQVISPGRSVQADEEGKIVNRDRTLKNAQKELRRQINANVGQSKHSDKFVTHTFREKVGMKQASVEWKNYIKRLSYHLGVRVKYLVIPEYGRKNTKRLHYHAIYFGLPWISAKELEKIWAQGFVKINKIDEVDNVGAYVAKYLSKYPEGVTGHKAYRGSRNLRKPVEVTDEKEIERLESALSANLPKFAKTFENEHRGKILYKQYIT